MIVPDLRPILATWRTHSRQMHRAMFPTALVFSAAILQCCLEAFIASLLSYKHPIPRLFVLIPSFFQPLVQFLLAILICHFLQLRSAVNIIIMVCSASSHQILPSRPNSMCSPLHPFPYDHFRQFRAQARVHPGPPPHNCVYNQMRPMRKA